MKKALKSTLALAIVIGLCLDANAQISNAGQTITTKIQTKSGNESTQNVSKPIQPAQNAQPANNGQDYPIVKKRATGDELTKIEVAKIKTRPKASHNMRVADIGKTPQSKMLTPEEKKLVFATFSKAVNQKNVQTRNQNSPQKSTVVTSKPVQNIKPTQSPPVKK